jgi:hypothetical protein
MLLSNFELFVKPQLSRDFVPPSQPNLEKLSRPVIQGYFLTIDNTTISEVIVSLVFTAVTPSVDIDKTFTFVDVTGLNIPSKLTRETAPGKVRFTVPIPANNICLFILQPDILKNGGELLKAANFEVCGHIEIFVSSLSLLRFARLLLTPEHQGKSFKDLTACEPEQKQIGYSFPTVNSGSLFNSSKAAFPRLESVLSSQSIDSLKILPLTFSKT